MSWMDIITSWFAKREARDPLRDAGARAAAEAERMWKLDIIDPPRGAVSTAAKRSLDVITGIVRDNGWTWEVPYTHNGQVQWCGMFAGACWRSAGLEPKWIATFWASTIRLATWARYLKWNDKSSGTRPATGARMLLEIHRDMKPANILFPDGTRPRAGDVVIVGDGTPKEGDHINVLVSLSVDGVFHTISGNGGGAGPDGKRREGVVKRDYTASATSGYRVLFVLRPGVDDLAVVP